MIIPPLQILDWLTNQTTENNPISAKQVVDIIERIINKKLKKLTKQSDLLDHCGYLEKNNQLTHLSIEYIKLLPVNFNQIIYFISRCYELRMLRFEYCNLVSIDTLSTLKHLDNLESLYIRNNQINKINTICELTNIQILDISFNPIETNKLGKTFTRTNLKKLAASSCQLNDCDFLTNQEQLIELDLSNNQLTSFSALKSLTKLEKLILNDNQLTNIDDLSQFKTLKKVDLSSNNIALIAYSVLKDGFQVTLNSIDLDNNSKIIIVNKNPLTTPPIEIVDQGHDAIINYFEQLQENEVEEADHLFEAKMLVVGEPGAGKTTLVRKIENPNTPLPKENETTRGVDVLRYDFPIYAEDFPDVKENINVEDKEFRVNLWDFGGQEIYLATHRFFLSKRALYALVSDSRKEDTDFNYWLHIVEMFGGNSPVLIILNQKDNREHQLDYSALKTRFKNIKDVKTVDLAQDNHTRLNQIRQLIRHEISKLPHIGSPLPTTWLQVRTKLEEDTNNTISPSTYLALCHQSGIKKTQDALILSQYFHDIGVFLHFQDDPILKNKIFLDPNWATNAIYQLLDDKVIYENLGLLTKSQANAIWKDAEFNELCDEFFQLMKKFHLVFEINNTGEYIVPAKLPAEIPKYNWPIENNIHLRYKYDEFMPKGILFHLMVELQHLIKKQNKVWRRGVIFYREQAKAEVIETYMSKEIKIRISGHNSRDLLVLIMDKLDQINSQYDNLKVEKLIPCHCKTCSKSIEPYFYKYARLERRRQKGKDSIECDESFEVLSVQALLNTVNTFIEPIKDIENNQDKINRDQVFISYSRKNRDILDRIVTHFEAAKNIGVNLNIWEDSKISAGDDWQNEIRQNLSRCKVAILLVSTDFLASDFIKKKELPHIINALHNKELTLLSVILDPCRFNSHPILSKFQSINPPEQQLSQLNEHDKAIYYEKLVDMTLAAL